MGIREDWGWLVDNPLVWLTSGRSDSLVTLLKRLGPRDSHNQGCRRPKVADLYGKWLGLEWEGLWDGLRMGMRRLVSIKDVASLYKGRRELVTAH